jgi:hypothetical protein
MAKYSEEKIGRLKAQIKQLIVQNGGNLSCRMAAKKLGLDRNYALKLIKEVEDRSKKEINNLMLEGELANLGNECREIKKRCWSIAHSKRSSPKAKLEALRMIKDTSLQLLNIGIKTGLFENNQKRTEQKIGESIQNHLDNLTNEELEEKANNIYKKVREHMLRIRSIKSELEEANITKFNS